MPEPAQTPSVLATLAVSACWRGVPSYDSYAAMCLRLSQPTLKCHNFDWAHPEHSGPGVAGEVHHGHRESPSDTLLAAQETKQV